MIAVDRATPADIPALMGIERGEGFDRLVGRWTADQHAAEMARPGSRCLVVRRDGEAAGFALVQGLDDPHGSATLRRIAVARPGEGLGAPMRGPASPRRACCARSVASPTAATAPCW